MAKGQTFFFADSEDMSLIIKRAEQDKEFKYFECGLFDTEEIRNFHSLLENESLGFVPFGDWNSNERFLVINKGQELNIRTVAQRKGGVKFAVDQQINMGSIVIVLGGELNSELVIAGKIGTLHFDEDSQDIMKLFSKVIRKSAKRVGSFYVLPGAMKKWKSGWRLTESVQSPVEYDLKCPN